MIGSVCFNILFWLYTFAIGLLPLPIEIVYRPFSLKTAKAWAHGTLWLLKICCGITHRISGLENFPNTPFLLASNHQSAWETVIYWTLVPKPVFVLKRELLHIPVFGWQLILLRSICIDRNGGAKAMKGMLRLAKTRVEEGYSIVIFPEGTRIAPGADSEYQPGVAAIYSHIGLPVVPAVVNSGLCWRKNAFKKTPGVITLRFLPPILPGLKGREFISLLKSRIVQEGITLPPV